MKRFHSHKNGCQWKQEDVVRYWFAEDFKGAGNWAVVKAVNGDLVSHSSNGEETGVVGFSVDEYLGIISDSGCSIEVQESDLPYLEKPDGDWEFREVESSDTEAFFGFQQVTSARGNIITGVSDVFLNQIQSTLSGRRWCAPRKVDAFESWWDENAVSVGYEATGNKDVAKASWYAAKSEGES